MNGTLINAGTILFGSLIGTGIGDRLPKKVRLTAMDGLGLVTAVIGLQMALKAENMLYVLGGVLLGAVLGEALDIDAKVNKIGEWAENSMTRLGAVKGERGRFARGFVMASLLFCVGPMAIMGSFQDGLTGDMQILLLKSALDGFSALAFSSSLGIGVAFSAIPLIFYQGSLTLASNLLESVLTLSVINDFTAAGGLLVFAIGLGLLEIKKIKVANLLPAVFFAPLIRYIAELFL